MSPLVGSVICSLSHLFSLENSDRSRIVFKSSQFPPLDIWDLVASPKFLQVVSSLFRFNSYTVGPSLFLFLNV